MDSLVAQKTDKHWFLFIRTSGVPVSLEFQPLPEINVLKQIIATYLYTNSFFRRM